MFDAAQSVLQIPCDTKRARARRISQLEWSSVVKNVRQMRKKDASEVETQETDASQLNA